MAVTVFKMSQVSMTMVEGRVVKWLKKTGDKVAEGEALVEIETDKVVVELTSPATGVVRIIAVPEGEYAPVGAPLCIIADANDDISPYAGDGGQPAAAPAAAAAAAPAPAPAPTPAGKIKISPLARKIGLERGVDFNALTGSGPGGLIVRADVETALTAAPAAAAPAAAANRPAAVTPDAEIIPLRGIRKRIAEHLTLSKQNAADVTTVMDVDMSKVAEYRKMLPISYTTFVVRAAAKALPEFPMLNSSLVKDEIHVKKQINICVAVSTPAGLVTPVIPDTDKKNILTVAEEMEELAQKARKGILSLADFANGTFTVTNSGTFGSLFFTPIINYPQCAILGIGKVAQTPVVRGNEIVAAAVMYLSLTYDHRIVDGETAVKFLAKVKHYLENPDRIVLNRND